LGDKRKGEKGEAVGWGRKNRGGKFVRGREREKKRGLEW